MSHIPIDTHGKRKVQQTKPIPFFHSHKIKHSFDQQNGHLNSVVCAVVTHTSQLCCMCVCYTHISTLLYVQLLHTHLNSVVCAVVTHTSQLCCMCSCYTHISTLLYVQLLHTHLNSVVCAVVTHTSELCSIRLFAVITVGFFRYIPPFAAHAYTCESTSFARCIDSQC
jgi:hypothetical protein